MAKMLQRTLSKFVLRFGENENERVLSKFQRYISLLKLSYSGITMLSTTISPLIEQNAKE
jgi:hypothetical protein